MPPFSIHLGYLKVHWYKGPHFLLAPCGLTLDLGQIFQVIKVLISIAGSRGLPHRERITDDEDTDCPIHIPTGAILELI